jgi:hypothetical protein
MQGTLRSSKADRNARKQRNQTDFGNMSSFGVVWCAKGRCTGHYNQQQQTPPFAHDRSLQQFE